MYYVTFRSARGELPPECRKEVCAVIARGDGSRFRLYVAAVMPDHVHVLLQPLEKGAGGWYDLSGIMKGIKGASARAVNIRAGMSGTVWQKESCDRIVRDEIEFVEKWRYILENPIRAGLAKEDDDYPFFVFGVT